VNVESKEQSKQWMQTHSPKKSKRFKQTLSARKLMAVVFWDRKGMLIVEFMKQRTIITSRVYCNTLNDLRRAIQSKRNGMLTFGVLHFHENKRLHASTIVRNRALLEHFNWELFDHPPCSTYLAPSDCHLFTYLKNWLRSQRFNNKEELMEGIKTCLSSQVSDFFDTDIQKRIPRYDKYRCIFFS
jgi:hypothetical protein